MSKFGKDPRDPQLKWTSETILTPSHIPTIVAKVVESIPTYINQEVMNMVLGTINAMLTGAVRDRKTLQKILDELDGAIKDLPTSELFGELMPELSVGKELLGGLMQELSVGIVWAIREVMAGR